MKNEEKTAALPVIARLYRYRQEEDIDRLADVLGLFPEESPEDQPEGEGMKLPKEDAAEDGQPPRHTEADVPPDQGESSGKAGQPPRHTEADVRLDEQTIRDLAERISMETVTRISHELQSLEDERLVHLIEKIHTDLTPVPEASASESAPLTEAAAGTGVSFCHPALAEAVGGLTKSQQDALLQLIEGGDRLLQAANLLLLEADELPEKSSDYQAVMRAHDSLIGILRQRQRNDKKNQ